MGKVDIHTPIPNHQYSNFKFQNFHTSKHPFIFSYNETLTLLDDLVSENTNIQREKKKSIQ